ncbi:hypothetical protein ACTXJX_18585 [Glutamicibacter ardleyensis]|uniref:hypothetical protein n=1 Tax=Glutamicibacter ardleyensis TaxID=225894 RepID=UPI003FD41CD0
MSDTEWATWRSGNDWYNAAYPDPCNSNPGVYDPLVNPHAAAWFKDTATHLLERIEPYLELLKRHDVQVVKLISADPGQIIYEDTVQIVVVPHEAKIPQTFKVEIHHPDEEPPTGQSVASGAEWMLGSQVVPFFDV